MDLKQIKSDRDNGVIISRCTWDAVLDRAISIEEGLEQIASLYEANEDASSLQKAHLFYDARCIARGTISFYAGIGKPDGEAS